MLETRAGKEDAPSLHSHANTQHLRRET
jgi:hypothetical protein